MLTINYQNEFERTLSKVLPYLIFAKAEDRDSLARKCQDLFHKLNGKDTEEQFREINEEIINLIKSKKLMNAWNQQQITDYELINKVHHTRFEAIESDIKEINQVHHTRIEKIESNIKKLQSKAPTKRMKELEAKNQEIEDNMVALKLRLDEMKNQENDTVEIIPGPVEIIPGPVETKYISHISQEKIDIILSLLDENPLYDKYDIIYITGFEDRSVRRAFAELNFKPTEQLIKAIFDSDIDNFTLKELKYKFFNKEESTKLNKVKINRCGNIIKRLVKEGKLTLDESGKYHRYSKVVQNP